MKTNRRSEKLFELIIGVDWRDSPKEDKQKFTKLCEVSLKRKPILFVKEFVVDFV